MAYIKDLYPVITMKEFNELKPGDKVRVVPWWNDKSGQNPEGYMNKYLGRIVTIDIPPGETRRVRIIEDKNDSPQRWYWNRYCFCEVVPQKEYEIASEEALSLLFA